MKNYEEFTWPKFLFVVALDILLFWLLLHDPNSDSKRKEECIQPGCHRTPAYGKIFCYEHQRYSGSGSSSKSSSSSTGSKSTYSSKSSSGTSKKYYYTDPDDYDDPDDYADDAWGVDFDSYDDAYDYWENY